MAYDFGFDGVATSSVDYAIEGESGGVSYPYIQATNYRPINGKQKIELGITADALAMAQSELLASAVEMQSFEYGDDATEVELGVFDDSVRWVILARPQVKGLDKASNKIVPLAKGMKERGEVTVSRLLLACVIDGGLVCDADGEPQIFTLKLKSSKTGFVGSERDKDFGVARNNGQRTIAQLNAGLVAHVGGKPGQWLGHIVSVELGAIAEKFGNAAGDASWGIRFVFPENSTAKALPKITAKKLFDFVSTDEFKALSKNPFGRAKPESADAAPEIEDDEMPF
jgi:hypothetical protein